MPITEEETVVVSERPPAPNPGPSSWGGGQDGTEVYLYLVNSLSTDPWDATLDQQSGWYYRIQSFVNGLYSESDIDQGPYDTRQDALDLALKHIHEPDEELELYDEVVYDEVVQESNFVGELEYGRYFG